MFRQLHVSRESYYKWIKRAGKASVNKLQQHDTDRLVKGLFYKYKRRYGAPRIANVLRNIGTVINRKTVAKSMKKQGLKAKAAGKYQATTDSNRNLPVYDNLVQQDFTATATNQKYVQDITYLNTGEGWIYLAVVVDLYSRKVVGWSMSERITAPLITDAMKMALDRWGSPAGVIVHSARGNQHCSNIYRDLVKSNKLKLALTLKGSMSKKGCCYDNACAESFFHTLKVEIIHGESYPTQESIRAAVFEYIEI